MVETRKKPKVEASEKTYAFAMDVVFGLPSLVCRSLSYGSTT